MKNNPSPLRYPGGKHMIYPFVKELLDLNGLQGGTYIEPFVGGAGLAIQLLLNHNVSRIIINDFDPHIYAFWVSVLYQCDDLCELIANTPVTIAQRDVEKEIFAKCDLTHSLELGFSTFFLNRVNISGILKGGVIGGKDQTGRYKLDVRFNKDSLIKKIQTISQIKDSILLFNLDVKDFLAMPEIKSTRNSLFNFDPPYVEKGTQLYMNSFKEKDHLALADLILHSKRKWIVTYDVNPLVLEAYARCRIGFLDVSYSVKNSRNALEYIVFSNNLIVPASILHANDQW